MFKRQTRHRALAVAWNFGAVEAALMAVLIFQPGLLAGADSPELAALRAEWYARATGQLASVVLFKPAESTNRALTQILAPLILQEIIATNGAANEADYFARLPGTGAESNRLTIYARGRKVRFNDREYDQVTYAWFYPPAAKSAQTAAQILPLQGVRLTLNGAGHPVICEPLAIGERLRPVFVAGSLEHLAQVRYQSRLLGRRFVIEPDLASQPEVVVPRIIEDSPVVFGPMLYLRAGTRAPFTLACRCMAAQAKAVAASHYYQLAPWPDDLEGELRPYEGMTRRQILERLAEFERYDILGRLRLPDKY